MKLGQYFQELVYEFNLMKKKLYYCSWKHVLFADIGFWAQSIAERVGDQPDGVSTQSPRYVSQRAAQSRSS